MVKPCSQHPLGGDIDHRPQEYWRLPVLMEETEPGKSNARQVYPKEHQKAIQVLRIPLRHKNREQVHRVPHDIIVQRSEDIRPIPDVQVPHGDLESMLHEQVLKDGAQVIPVVGKGTVMLAQPVAAPHIGFPAAVKDQRDA